jgi:hypothetical protein
MTRLLIPPILALFLLAATHSTAGAADITGTYVKVSTGGLCYVQPAGNNRWLFQGEGGGQATFRAWDPARGVLVLDRTDGTWPETTIVTAGMSQYGRVFLDIWAPGIGRELWRQYP